MRDVIFCLLFYVLPYCSVEDDNWCKWDASVQGNGRGNSFVTLADNTFVLKGQAQ